MLQSMQQKVEAEGKAADELNEKRVCQCKTSGESLAASIAAAEAKVGELGPAIEAAQAKKKTTEAELKSHQDDRAAAKTAMAEATSVREKEKKAYDKVMADTNMNLQALDKAISALNRG